MVPAPCESGFYIHLICTLLIAEHKGMHHRLAPGEKTQGPEKDTFFLLAQAPSLQALRYGLGLVF